MAKLIRTARPHLINFAENLKFYGKTELVPPKLSELGQVKDGVGNLVKGASDGRWKQLTVREAWLNTCITLEVVCWFFIGECIGKRSLVGYQV